jgi:opacity protein-like surface antigen
MTKLKRISIIALVLNAFMVNAMVAQDYNLPLSMEGLNHTSNTSILSKSLGGVTIPLQKDVSLMFANPAILSTLDALTISVGALQAYTSANQTQQWQGSTYYGNYSLLMDGSLVGISHSIPADTAYARFIRSGGKPFPGDTLWIPYDKIGPNWSHDKSPSELIPNIFAALPFTVKGIKATVGLGYAEYANLDYYYQNNTAQNPNPNELMAGQGVVKGDSTRRVNWYQTIHSREGNLHSIGGALSINITQNISAGVTAKYITGSTDDIDQTLGRGVIWFMSSGANVNKVTLNSIRLDSVDYKSSIVGKSDYTGYEGAISAAYRGKDVTIGVSVTLPTEIERKFNGTTTSYTNKTKDYAAVPYSSVSTSITQKMDLPIKGSIGLGMQVRSNVYIAAEYEYDPYSKADLKTNGVTTNPWLDATSFHLGIKWEPVEHYSLRFGYRRQSDVFQAQYSAFDNQPVSYIAYSAGIGVQLMKRLELNAAYEFYEQKYEDTWVDNSNINILNSNSVSIGLQYTLQ